MPSIGSRAAALRAGLEARARVLAPLLAAALATAVVVAVVVVSNSDVGGRFPAPPDPIRPVPAPLDAAALSLDRCSGAIEAAGLADRYPPRADWRPLARLFTGSVEVSMLDGPVPFVCATGPTTVDVSDPGAAVPIGPASLLLSSPAGVLAAAAPDGATVEVAGPSDRRPGRAAARYFVHVHAQPITTPGELTVAVGDPAGLRPAPAPTRLALPALHVVDRTSVPADRSSGAADMLRRCLAAQPAGTPTPAWDTAQVLAYRRADQPASLLVATGPGVIGGCSLDPGEVTPMRVWQAADDSLGGESRPFVWLPEPGAALPDLVADIAAGPVQPHVVRMEVAAGSGPPWPVRIAGATFATQLPAGMPRDPRLLTVLAFDAADQLVYRGPGAG